MLYTFRHKSQTGSVTTVNTMQMTYLHALYNTSRMLNVVGASLSKQHIDWASYLCDIWSNLQCVMHEFHIQHAARVGHIVVAIVLKVGGFKSLLTSICSSPV